MVWKRAGTSCPVPQPVSESTAASEEGARNITGVGHEVPVMGIWVMPLKLKPLNCGCMKDSLSSSSLLHFLQCFPIALLCDGSTAKQGARAMSLSVVQILLVYLPCTSRNVDTDQAARALPLSSSNGQ